jgi:uncharacterized protein (DUF2384 family)
MWTPLLTTKKIIEIHMSNSAIVNPLDMNDISPQLARELARAYNLSLKALAMIIGCTSSQIYRNRLDERAKHHIVLLIELKGSALSYFGSVSKSQKWFATYNISLAATPIELINSLKGIASVKNCIAKLEHGMTA